MRIIHGKDYYDTAQSMGQDETLTFVREKDRALADQAFFRYNQELRRSFHIKLRDRKTSHPIPFDGYREGLYTPRGRLFALSGVIVIFCGKIHHGLKIDHYDDARTLTETSVQWTEAAFLKWLDRAGLAVDKIQDRYYDWEGPSKSQLTADQIIGVNDVSRALVAWLIANRIVAAIRVPPVRYWRDEPGSWAINSDGLGAVEFYKVYAPVIAFQDIAMWIGGVLPASANPTVTISDTVRLEKHGFDRKASFRHRKPP